MHKTISVVAVLGLFAVWAGCGGSSVTPAPGGSSGDVTGDSGDGTGADDGGGGSTDTDGASTAAVCTSGKHWTNGDRGSSLMHPGRACITCHQQNRGPRLTIGGTVFPTQHEPDDCDGVDGSKAGITVVITGNDGKTTTIHVNAAGNFYYQGAIAMPFKAKVVSGGNERDMSASQTTGDCNSCHTQDGANDAPGRIQAP